MTRTVMWRREYGMKWTQAHRVRDGESVTVCGLPLSGIVVPAQGQPPCLRCGRMDHDKGPLHKLRGKITHEDVARATAAFVRAGGEIKKVRPVPGHSGVFGQFTAIPLSGGVAGLVRELQIEQRQ